MISKIGYKRALTIVVLAAVMAILGASSYLLFRPQTQQIETELQTAKSDAQQRQTEVDKMQTDFNLYEQEKDLYERLSKTGFFGTQNRVTAREKFNTIQKLSKVISVQYDIKPAKIDETRVPPESDFVVIESPITVSLDAVDDLDIYRFVYYLNYAFAGHITINSMELRRDKKVDLEALKQIGTGNPQPLVSAVLDLSWRTMAKKDTISPQDLQTDPNAAEGGQ